MMWIGRRHVVSHTRLHSTARSNHFDQSWHVACDAVAPTCDLPSAFHPPALSCCGWSTCVLWWVWDPCESHFSRLWRLVHHYQTLYHERVFSLHVMACSATLANPHEHFNALFPSKSSSSEGDSDSDSLVVITDDTPPSDAKELIMSWIWS